MKKISTPAKSLLAVLLLGILMLPSQAETLTIGVVGAEPFVSSAEEPDGISIRIWKRLAVLGNIDYQFIRFESVQQLLKSVAEGNVDVAVGPISITSQRADIVSFTQPYFRADLGILSRVSDTSFWAALSPFLSKDFVYGILFLLIILTLVGSLIWFVEKKANPEQFPEGLSGVGNGMWFAIVTMTTVGYGDRSPVTPTGRVLSGIWMLIATISFSTLTAGIAATLALTNFEGAAANSPEQLRGRRVVAVMGSTGSIYAQKMGARLVNKRTLSEAIETLRRGEAVALVFDHPALEYYLLKNPEKELVLAESHFAKQDYGFALNLENDLTHELNVSLLKLAESGELREIEHQWLSNIEANS